MKKLNERHVVDEMSDTMHDDLVERLDGFDVIKKAEKIWC